MYLNNFGFLNNIFKIVCKDTYVVINLFILLENVKFKLIFKNFEFWAFYNIFQNLIVYKYISFYSKTVLTA